MGRNFAAGKFINLFYSELFGSPCLTINKSLLFNMFFIFMMMVKQ